MTLFITAATLLMMTMLMASSRAFTSSSFRPVALKQAATTSASARFLSSSSPMPYDDDKMVFYTLGTNLALQLGGSVLPILDKDELEIVLDAFSQHLRGTATQDARTILETFGPQLNKILQERADLMVEGNKKAGQAFVAKFLETHPDATTTDSGLVLLETLAGTGESPTMESMVEVNYHGTLTDGTVVDSSVERGESMNFPLKDVIKGWGEALQLMKEGGKATVVIPSDLAYGDGGSSDVIPGGATLKFDVELIHVSTPKENKVQLPDGSTIRLPEGVKVRMVDEE